MKGDRAGVVIVGGGVIGCATAYYLARGGAQVTLLERASLCSEASSAAAGILTVSARQGLFLTLAREGARLLLQAREELETDFGLAQRGSLTLAFTDEEMRKQRALVEQQRQQGIEIECLDRQAALEREPEASPAILGAFYSPIDCSTNPYLTTLAFARAARRHGAAIRTGVEVTGLKAEGGRVRAALTGQGELTGDLVVVAAGAWSPFLTRTVGLELPIEPSRGQIMVTEPLPPLSRSVVKDTGHMYICPTRRGNCVIGSMTEKVGFDKQLTPEKLREYVSEAVKLVPSLRRARILHAWAGLRPLTPDDLPVLGEVPGYEGLVLAAGHSRTGVLLSAVTSRMVAELITTGVADPLLDQLGLGRFGN